MNDDIYADDALQVVRDSIARPMRGPVPQPDHTWADLAKAPFQGLAGGGLESAASSLEEASGFGQVMAATGTMSTGGMFAMPDATEQQQNTQASNKLLSQGLDMSDPQADQLRLKARDVMPDAQTTSTAAQMVAGFTRFAGKGVGYIGLGGPAGAIPLGVDEGLTEADRLKQQGVDLATRTKAGAVAGLVAGGSMVAPMGAATALGRFGVGAAVGEATNIGQAESEKLILQHAGYDQIASQYDPFDPVSLAVGLVPGVIGAALGHGAHAAAVPFVDAVEHMESHGQRFDADGNLLQGPVTATGERAQGEMQVMSKTARDPGFGVTPAKDDSPEELARVGRDYATALEQHYDGDQAKAFAAYNWGPGHMDALLKAHPDDWQAHLPDETQRYVQQGMALTGGPDAATVAAARVTQTADALDRSRLTPDDDLAGRDAHQQAVETAFDQMGRGDDVEVNGVLGDTLARMQESRSLEDQIVTLQDAHAEQFSRSQLEESDDTASLRAQLEALQDPGALRARAAEIQVVDPTAAPREQRSAFAAAMQRAQEELPARQAQLEAQVSASQQADRAAATQAATRARALEQQIAKLSENASASPGVPNRLALAVREGLSTNRASGFPESFAPELGAHEATEAARLSVPSRIMSLADAVQQLRDLRSPPELAIKPNHAAFHEAEAPEAGETAAPAEAAKKPAGEGAPRETSPLDGAIAQLQASHPDLMVHMDGMESPMRFSDLLENLRQEAKETGDDSRLLEVAAQCAISS